jgi:hypothetical protein
MLTSEQIDSFIELGYCIVPGAFTRRQAEAACEQVWRNMEKKAGIRKDDPSTWPDAYDIEQQLSSPEVLACFTDRLASSIEQIVGFGRWLGQRRWGFWPVNFSHGSGSLDRFPDYGWHIDGNWFRHSIDCPKQGLLVIGLFTDIVPRSGGTVLALGSHNCGRPDYNVSFPRFSSDNKPIVTPFFFVFEGMEVTYS